MFNPNPTLLAMDKQNFFVLSNWKPLEQTQIPIRGSQFSLSVQSLFDSQILSSEYTLSSLAYLILHYLAY